jgi:hypothetical protein
MEAEDMSEVKNDMPPQYPDPRWFKNELGELKARMDAMLKLAKANGIDLRDVYPSRTARMTLKQAAYQVLRAAERPLHMKEMLKGVAELGVPAGGRRPGNTLHATLSQDRRVELVGTNTWSLTAEERDAIAALPKTEAAEKIPA